MESKKAVKKNSVILCLAAIVILSVIVLRPFLGYHCEDAMISFRYARNLAEGHGFVFNPGERVLGTSSPLFTLILAACSLAGAPIPESADILNIAFHILACVAAYGLISLYVNRITGIAGALALAFCPALLTNIASGMETPLYSLLILGSFYFYSTGKRKACWLLCGLTIITRPEGFLVPLILFVDMITMHDRRERLRGITIFIVIATSWVLFGLIYFNSPIPQSMFAKLSIYTQQPTPFRTRIYELVPFRETPLEIITLACFIAGLLSFLKFGRRTALLSIWWLLYSISLLTARGYIFQWYYVPAITVYMILAVIGGSMVIRPFLAFFQKTKLSRGIAIGVMAAIGVILVRWWRAEIDISYRGMIYHYNRFARPHLLVADWLKGNTPEDALICAGDIGHIGFYSGRRILDYNGLVSPEALSFRKSGNRLGLFDKYKPPYVAGGYYGIGREIANDPLFKGKYELITTFELKDSIRWLIFKRKEENPREYGREP